MSAIKVRGILTLTPIAPKIAKDFAPCCMRTYLILKHKAEQWNANPEIQTLVKELSFDCCEAHSNLLKPNVTALLAHNFNKDFITRKRLQYERLDQLTIDVLLGA